MQVIRLNPIHAREYRELMLHGYSIASDAFTATVREREQHPLSWWEDRVSDLPDAAQMVFGALVQQRLVGAAGLRHERRPRTRHKATLFGMFVLPNYSGRGVARGLVQAVLDHARSTPGTHVVQLTVAEENQPALRLYESCGFVPFGLEPLANRVEDRFIPQIHMWCPVEGSS